MNQFVYKLPVLILEDNENHLDKIIEQINSLAIAEFLEFDFEIFKQPPNELELIRFMNSNHGDKLIIIDRNFKIIDTNENVDINDKKLINEILDLSNKSHFYIVYSKLANPNSNQNTLGINYHYIKKRVDDNNKLTAESLHELRHKALVSIERIVSFVEFENSFESYPYGFSGFKISSKSEQYFDSWFIVVKEMIRKSNNLHLLLEDLMYDFNNVGIYANFIGVGLTGSYARGEARENSDVEIIFYYKAVPRKDSLLSNDNIKKVVSILWNRINVYCYDNSYTLEGNNKKFTKDLLLHNLHDATNVGYQPYIEINDILSGDKTAKALRAFQLFSETISIYNPSFIINLKKQLFLEYYNESIVRISALAEKQFLYNMCYAYINQVFKLESDINGSDLKPDFKTYKKLIYRITTIYSFNLGLIYLDLEFRKFAIDYEVDDVITWERFFEILSNPLYIKVVNLYKILKKLETKVHLFKTLNSIVKCHTFLDNLKEKEYTIKQSSLVLTALNDIVESSSKLILELKRDETHFLDFSNIISIVKRKLE